MSNYYGADGYPIPTGAILPFVASTRSQIPASFLYCNGTDYDSRIYPELFAVIGNQYNTGGEPAGFFRVPNLVNHPYIKSGAFNPVPNAIPTITEDVPIAVENLPPLSSAGGEISVSDMTFTVTSPNYFEHHGGSTGDTGTNATAIKNDSSTRGTFSVAITGGSASYTPAVPPVPAVATATFDEFSPEGYLFIHIIKAVQVSIAPQTLAPVVVPQFPAPQYLYTNMAWLNGFTDFNF
jgi:hypothetical protein